MVHFMAGSLFGIIGGYFLCIGHAKLTLAIHRRTPEGRQEEADRRHTEWVQHHPLPQTPVAASCEPVCEPVELTRTERCPDGYSAAQILGYNYCGRIQPSLYPGGKETFLAEN